MAKKGKNGNDFDDIDIDDLEFDFDSFDIDPMADDRKPVTKIKETFVKDVKSNIASPSFLKQVMRRALPTEYGEAYDVLEGAAEKGADLYNKSTQKLQPTINTIKKRSQALLPVTEKILPKSVQEKLKGWTESFEEDFDFEISKEQQREDELTLVLGDVFQTQIEENARLHEESKNQVLIESAVSNKRHEQNMVAMDSLRQGISSLVAYQDNVTIKFQRKSLEIQYRQLFATKDLIEYQNLNAAKHLEALQAVVKNTALPDAIKIQGSEAFGAIARDRFITKIQSSALNSVSKVLDRITGNFNQMVDEKLEGFIGGVDQLNSAIEMTDGMDRSKLFGSLGANVATDALGNIAGDKIGKKFRNNAKVRAGAAKAGSFMDNISAWFNNFSETETVVNTDSLLGRAKGAGIDFTKSLLRASPADLSAGDMTANMNTPSAFSIRSNKSLTDIIPGYLSRILREITVLRTGDETTPLLMYSLGRDNFTSGDRFKSEIRNRILSKGGKESAKFDLERTISTLDPKQKLSSEAKKTLSKQLMINAKDEKGLFVKALADQKRYNKEFDPEIVKELAEFFRKEYKTDVKRKLGEEVEIDERVREASSRFKYIASSVPSLIDEIELQIKLGNRSLMEDMGFLIYKDGESRLNFEAIVTHLTEEDNDNGRKSFTQNTSGSVDNRAPYQYANDRSNIFNRTDIIGNNSINKRFGSTRTSLDKGFPNVQSIDKTKTKNIGDRLESFTKKSKQSVKAKTNDVISKANDSFKVPDALKDKISSIKEASDNKIDYATEKTKGILDLIIQKIDGIKDSVADNAPKIKGQIKQWIYPQKRTEEFIKSPESIAVEKPEIVPLEEKTAKNSFREEIIRLLTNSLSANEVIKERITNIDNVIKDGITLNTADGKSVKSRGFTGGLRSGLGGLLSGSGKLLGKTMGMYGNLLGGFGALGKSTLSQAGNLVTKIGGSLFGPTVKDIYVKGEKVPALFAKAIKAGAYKDKLTGKTIRTVKDITGPVLDADGNEALTAEEFSKGLYDIQGKSLIRRGAGMLLDFYGAMFKPFTTMASLANKTLMYGYNKLTESKDIYVKGEDSPRLLARIINDGGYFSKTTGKVIRSVKDIDGPVVDRERNVVLTLKDLTKGLVGSDGKPIRTLGDKLFGLAAGATKFALSAGKSMLKFGFNLGMLPIKLGAKLLGKGGNFLARGAGLSFGESLLANSGNSTVALLSEIRTILDDRLPGKRKKIGDTDGDGDIENSWQDKLRRKKDQLAEAAKGKLSKAKDGGLFSSAFGGLSSLLGKKGNGEETAPASDDDTIIVDGGGGDSEDKKDKSKTKDKAKPKGKFGKAMSKVGGWLKKMPGAGTIGRLGSAGLSLARGAILASALTGAFAVGGSGVGAAIMGGLGALATGIAAVVASPLFLGALAVVAVGTAGYFAYKYLKGNKNDFQLIRLRQYGISPENETQADKAISLESSVDKFVSISGTEAKMNISSEDVLKLMEKFEVDIDSEKALKNWVTWFNERFKPIYLLHKAAAMKVSGLQKLHDVDNKFTAAQKLEMLKHVKLPSSTAAYGVLATPFKGPLSGTVAEIGVAFSELENKLTKENEATKTAPTSTPTMPIATGGAGVSVIPRPQTPPVNKAAIATITSNTVSTTSLPTKDIEVTSPYGSKTTIKITGKVSEFNAKASSLTPLDCVRYKTYGLVELDIDKVRALKELEKEVLKDITFTPKGAANFDADVTVYLNKFSGLFGVSMTDSKSSSNWVTWFTNRFLPTLVSYCTAVREISDTIDILDAPTYLKHDQALQVAIGVMNSKYGWLFSRSVWGIENSPWANYSLNVDSDSVNGNIEAIKNSIKNRSYQDIVAFNKTIAAIAPKPQGRSTVSPMDAENDALETPSIFSLGNQKKIANSQPNNPPATIARSAEGNDTSKFGGGDYTMPTEGRISSTFGPRIHPLTGANKMHQGIDIAAPNGTPVRAAAGGVITRREYSSSYGNVVYIKHGDGKVSRYAHMQHFQPNQSVGAEIRQGTIIGYVGNTGKSAGNHLHFEIRDSASYNAKAIDPLKVLGKKESSTAIDELKGYEKTVKAEAKPDDSPTIEGQDTIASTINKTTNVKPPLAMSEAMTTVAQPSVANGFVPTAPVNDVRVKVDPEKVPEKIIEKQKAFEDNAIRTVQIKNQTEKNRMTNDISAVMNVLQESLAVHRSMDSKLGDLVKGVSNLKATPVKEPEVKENKQTSTVSKGKRPVETPVTANPISVRKTTY